MDNQNQNQQIQKAEQDVFNSVMKRVSLFQQTGELRLPKDYSPENAIKAAFLIISEMKDKQGNPVLNVVSKESVSKSLLAMVTEGLNPLKKQGAFVVYGNQLQWQREYFGSIALAKRFGLKSIKGVAVFDGDMFEFKVENGIRQVVKHEQKLENIGTGIVKGAYAIYEMEDGTRDVEIMNMKQIMNSWNQGYAKGQSGAHKNFPDQMAIKTVINRACKLIINSSNDSNLMGDEFEPPVVVDAVAEEVKSEIKSNANQEVLDMDQIPTKQGGPEMQMQEATEEIPDVFK